MLVKLLGSLEDHIGSLGRYLKTRGGPIWDQGNNGEPVGGPYMTKGGHRDLIRSPKGSEWHPFGILGNPMGMISHLFFLIFCEILFCLLLTFSFVTFSLLTQIQRSWSISNRERTGHKENICYFWWEFSGSWENCRKQSGKRIGGHPVPELLHRHSVQSHLHQYHLIASVIHILSTQTFHKH